MLLLAERVYDTVRGVLRTFRLTFLGRFFFFLLCFALLCFRVSSCDEDQPLGPATYFLMVLTEPARAGGGPRLALAPCALAACVLSRFSYRIFCLLWQSLPLFIPPTSYSQFIINY